MKLIDEFIKRIDSMYSDECFVSMSKHDWQMLKAVILAQQTNNSAIVSTLQFLRDSVPSVMESYPQAVSFISQLEERLNNIVK